MRNILLNTIVKGKDIYTCICKSQRNLGFRRMQYPEDIQILYKSSNYLVVEKAYDLKINSNDDTDQVTVESLVADKFPELIDPSVAHRFRFAHRLDYATSGVLVLSLNKKAASLVQKAFQKRQVTKYYLALVYGTVAKENIFIDEEIGRDTRETEVYKMSVRGTPGCLNPRHSETELVTLEHGLYNGSPASKVLLIPHTGRTHQLRVHCNHIGHRIIGDYMYSDRQDTEPYRMMLHSFHLSVNKIIRGEQISVTSSDPFVPETDSKWSPSKVLLTYEQFTSEKLELPEKSKALSS